MVIDKHIKNTEKLTEKKLN